MSIIPTVKRKTLMCKGHYEMLHFKNVFSIQNVLKIDIRVV